MEETYLGALFVLDPREVEENRWVKLIEPSNDALELISDQKWPGVYIQNASSISKVKQGISGMFGHIFDSVHMLPPIDSEAFYKHALHRIEEEANVAENAKMGVLRASKEPKEQFMDIIDEISDIFNERMDHLVIDDYSRSLLRKHFKFQMDGLRIYRDRNEKYGDSFNKNFKEFGGLYPVVRIGEKYERLKGFAKAGGHIKIYGDESIIDTLTDISNYSIMMANAIIDHDTENKERE